VNADGDYVGAAIAPGVEVSMEALTTRAEDSAARVKVTVWLG